MASSCRLPGTGRRGARGWAFAQGVLLLALAGCGCCSPEVEGPSPPGTTTAEFLGPDDFSGEFLHRCGDTKFGGQATWEGRAIVVNVPDTAARQMLPSGFQLAKNTPPHANLHPVLVLLGHQLDSKYVLPSANPAVGVDYTEMIVLLPFVQKAGKQRWHNLIVRIYLDDLAALYLGNLYYGTMKEEATFTETPSSVEVRRNGVPWFTATFSPNGPWMDNADAETTLPNYPALQTILEMPVQGTLTHVPGTPPACSYFEWSYATARVRRVSAKLAFLQPLRTGVTSWTALGQLGSVGDGAWEIEKIRWRLAFPPIECEL